MKTKYLTLIALAVFATSCRKPYHEYRLQDETKSWFIDDDKCHFDLRDENGITQSFQIGGAYIYFMEEDSHFMGVLTEESKRETGYQTGHSSFSIPFSICVTAGWGNEINVDDRISIELCEAHYDLSLSGTAFTPLSCSDWGGNVNNMAFQAEVLDAFAIEGVSYADVLHIQLIDLAYPQSANFPTEIYYAKHYGLIQCTLDDKVTLYRLPN